MLDSLLPDCKRILIIEDEAPAARRLSRLVQEILPACEEPVLAASVAQAVQELTRRPLPDLILSDIELGDGQSFEVFRQVKVPCPVIFCTAYDEYALKAFETNGVAYLLKPISEEALRKALEKVGSLTRHLSKEKESSTQNLDALLRQLLPQTARPQRLLLRYGDRLVPLALSEVAYFLSHDKATWAVTDKNTRLPVDQPLDELEATLPPGEFFRVGRPVLARVSAIRNIYAHLNGKLKLILFPDPEQEIFVSREKASAFKDWIMGRS